MSGLLDPTIMGKKKADEKHLREAAANNTDLKEAAGAWDKIAAAQKVLGQNSVPFNMLEGGRGFNTKLFSFARTLLRAGDERPKANGERLAEYRDSGVEAMKERLGSKEPTYPDYEMMKLANSLTYPANNLGLITRSSRKSSPVRRRDPRPN